MLNATPLPSQTTVLVTHTMREGLVRAGISPGRKQVVEGDLNGQPHPACTQQHQKESEVHDACPKGQQADRPEPCSE